MRTILRFSFAAALLALAACASAPAPDTGDSPRGLSPVSSIPIEIRKPEGDGPFPAVVVLHDCSGLGPRSSGSPKRWADLLVREGYVVAIPDSFSTRGHAAGVCTVSAKNRGEVAPARRVRDAYEALAYLRRQPFVDGAHVAVMGGSHGGATTVLAMRGDRKDGFAAAVALYPSCDDSAPYHAYAPLLILAGALDDWTPAAPCERLAKAATGAPVRIKVYPGAHHAFDSANPVRYVGSRANRNSATGHGATTGGNPGAWKDSIEQVTAFFARYLRAH